MVQIVPQFVINQIFEATPDALVDNLRPLVIGPDYVVRSYEDDKADVSLGEYVDEDLAVNWPGKLTGEVVDQDYTSVKMDSAALLYHLDQNDTETAVGAPHKIYSATKSWADNGAYARSGSIPCDVKVGDWVRASIGSVSKITSVTRLIPDVVPATVDATPDADGDNVPTDAGSSSAADDVGNTGTATADVSTANNEDDYQGENVGAHGQMEETYTLTVIAVGAEGTGNAGDWSTVELEVTSDSETDPTMTITPIVNTLVSIGSRGAQVRFNHGGSGDDWVIGDVFTVEVVQAYTIPTKAAAGTYTGSTDTTYLVRVTKGGASGVAEVSISTSTATDMSGPHVVTTATPIVIGTKGVTVTLTGTTFVIGDLWAIDVTAATTGAIHTLELADELEADLQGDPLKVELAILKNIDVPKNREGSAPLVNWSQSATQITLESGIESTDERVDDEYLEVLIGDAYVTYRALRTAGANVVRDISVDADVSTHFSGLDLPDAGMSYGLKRGLSNSAGTTMKAISVATDNLAGYQTALNKLREREDIYRIVPLTHDEEIIDACISTALTRSGSSVGRWATVMMSLALSSVTAVVGEGEQLATITDDPDAGGTQYTLVTDEDGQFITLGVLPGDTLRAIYTTDGFDNPSYTEFVVDAVQSEQVLRVVAGPSVAVNTASKYEIWRTLSEADQAEEWGARTQARSNRRVTSVFPPEPGRAGARVPGYYLACSLAALRGASAPHQGLTNAAVADWDDLEQTSVTFGDLLDDLANYGAYIVTEDPAGRVYIRKQLTTDISDVKHAEDSATTNCDSISYYFKNLLAAKIGVSNVVPSNLDGMRADITAGINFLKTSSFTTALGGQINDDLNDVDTNKLLFLRPHATLLDKVVARVKLNLPIPLNNGELDIVV